MTAETVAGASIAAIRQAVVRGAPRRSQCPGARGNLTDAIDLDQCDELFRSHRAPVLLDRGHQMDRQRAHRPPTWQEMQTSLARWQNVLLHISSAWGEPGAPWHGPVVMARYRLDALAAAQEISALLERMNGTSSGIPVRARSASAGISLGTP
jgi:hypothetical protein